MSVVDAAAAAVFRARTAGGQIVSNKISDSAVNVCQAGPLRRSGLSVSGKCGRWFAKFPHSRFPFSIFNLQSIRKSEVQKHYTALV